jgi:hypothetical protein
MLLFSDDPAVRRNPHELPGGKPPDHRAEIVSAELYLAGT